MNLFQPTAEVWIPDGKPEAEALARTTHLAIVAHQDDIEIMAMEGILDCFGRDDKWLCGVVVTDGAGSARDSLYKDYTDEQMKAVRRMEQKKAAFVGEFGSQIFLDHPSSAVKDHSVPHPRRDLHQILEATKPETVYLHNLADKHPTHIGVALRSIQAMREFPVDQRPKRVIGCEVWRDLDWMLDSDKVVMRVDSHENIQMSLVGVFDSQIVGGKRYDTATMGRRRAHATYHESHSVDASQLVNFGMDLTPLIHDKTMDIANYVTDHIQRFATSVQETILKMT